MSKQDRELAWTGVFRRIQHRVPDDARKVRFDNNRWVHVAHCGALCWPFFTTTFDNLPECPSCFHCSNNVPSWPPEEKR